MQGWRTATALTQWVSETTEELAHGNVLLEGAYSIFDWRPPARPYRRLIKVASWIGISLLSLGLWVALFAAPSAIWKVT